MLKYVYIFTEIIFLTSTIKGQTIQKLGIEVGYVRSNQTHSFEDINKTKVRKNGFSAGIFAEIFNHDFFSLLPEIKYFQKGLGIETLLLIPTALNRLEQ